MRLGYACDDILGNGGFGKVFAAKITSVGTEVALKKARVTNHIRHPVLLHEARVLILLRGHPSIPDVFAWGRSQYFEYLAMELLGPNLENIAKGVGLTQRNVLPLICQMIDAIEYVHGEGFLHGDIKPSNFVLGRGDNAGKLYLIDFGFAWRYSSGSSHGARRGTVPYSSLNVLRGEAPLPRDDFESLAYTIARIMAGPLPWCYMSVRQRLHGGPVSGRDVFPDCACYPNVFAQFVDFACGLAPGDDLQYRRWRETFRALDSGLPDHPTFDPEDRSGNRRWLRWVPGPPAERDDYLQLRGSNDRQDEHRANNDTDLFGGPDSRSETGGEHGFQEGGNWSSEWSLPVALAPCCMIGDEFEVVSGHLELIEEPPLYDGGLSVDAMRMLRVGAYASTFLDLVSDVVARFFTASFLLDGIARTIYLIEYMPSELQVEAESLGQELPISPGIPSLPGSKAAYGAAQVVDALKEGNAALKDANAALRELVASLQNERRLLIDKNSELEAKLEIRLFKEHEIEPSLRAQHLSPLDIASLPQEIVLRICLAVIPGGHQYDSSILAGPRSPWLESLNTRKSLTLVCRAWNGPASEALYTDIVFRRMGQISALARTFRASAVVNAPHRVRFVKRIYINSCAIMSSCENVIKEDLTYLLRHCTELESFMFRSHPRMEYAVYGALCHPSSMFNPPWILDIDEACVHALEERCATGLQELVFATDLTPDQSLDVLRIIQVGVNLKSLTLGAISLPLRGWNFTEMGAQPAELPRLEELQIHLNHYTDSLSDFISESWTLPRLERLTLVGCDYLPECLLTAHGLRLRYLHFVPDRREPWLDGPAYTPLEVVGQCCPMLEHLVMPFLPALDPLCTLDSPTLRYLDLWGSPHKRRVVELWGEMGRASLLPELVSVRLLPAAHVVQLPVDLPRICHPEDVGADEVLVRTFPCVRVLQTSWALLADVGNDRGVSFVDEELDEGDSDAESSWYGSEGWVEGEEEVATEGEGGEENEGNIDLEVCYDDGTSWVSESAADDTTSISSSDDDDGGDAADGEEIEQLEFDRDTVLEMFTASQMVDFKFLFNDDSTDDAD